MLIFLKIRDGLGDGRLQQGIKMTLDEAVSHFGSGWRMCMQLGLRAQNYSYWKKVNRIPVLQQVRIEDLTNGVLRADKDLLHRKNRMD